MKGFFIVLLLLFLSGCTAGQEKNDTSTKNGNNPMSTTNQDTATADMDKQKPKLDEEESMERAKRQSKLREELNTELKKVGIEIEFIRVVGDMYYEEDQFVIKLKAKTDKRNTERLKAIRNIVEEKVKENSDGYRLEPATYSYWELEDIMNGVLGSPITLSKNTTLSMNTIENRIDVTTDHLSKKDRDYIKEHFGPSVKVIIDPDYELTNKVYLK